MKRTLFLLLIWLWAPLSAQIKADDPRALGPPTNPLDILQGEPSAVVAQAVNAITGDYIDFQTDITISGAQTLTLQRFYNSSDDEHSKMFRAWKFNHDIRVQRGSADEDDDPAYFLCDSLGARIPFDWVDRSHGMRFHKVPGAAFERHITNTGQGGMTARNHLKNWGLVRHADDTMVAHVGAGVTYHFPKCKKQCYISRLQRPSSFNILYKYDDRKLKSVEATNRAQNIISSLTFTKEHTAHQRSMTVKASNGKHAKYIFKKIDHRTSEDEWLIKQVQRSEGQTVNYKYDGKPQRLISKMEPKGNFLNIEYYQKGNNRVWENHNERVHGVRAGRVMKLSAPVGETNQPVPIYRFMYYLEPVDCVCKDPNFNECYKYKINAGHTEVFDAKNHQINYHFNKDQRLVCIEKFTGHRKHTKPYSQDNLYWGTGEEPTQKCQLKRRVFSALGRALLCKEYKYDKSGNLKKEHLYGNLTGTKPQRLAVKKDGSRVENDCDVFTIERDYNERQLLARESHPTLPYHYEYEYNSHEQLIHRFTIADKIRKREIFIYDDQGHLIREIVDDGHSRNRDDLGGVTERHVKIYSYDLKQCPLGLPVSIQEMYRDLTAGHLCLMHKVENTYWPSGELKQQKHYNNLGALEYTLSWKYDRFGHVIEECNALGHVIKRQYNDETGLLEWEQGPRNDATCFYDYDTAQRLKSKEERWSNGTQLTTTYKYNVLSQCVQMTDIYQQATQYDYDEFGRMTTVRYPSVIDEEGHLQTPVEKREYDACGYVTKLTDPLGHSTMAEYTIRGQPYHIRYADGSEERFEYSLQGQLVKAIARNGACTTYQYDYLGRPVAKQVRAHAGEGAELLESLKCEYNAFHLKWEEDNAGNRTNYEYDYAGRLVSKRKNDQRTEFKYDVMNRLNETRVFFGPDKIDYIATVQTFDPLNRVTQETVTDAAGKIYSQVSYAYNDLGERREVITFDAEDRQINVKRFNPHGDIESICDAEGHETKIAHLYPSRHVETTDANGLVSRVEYDALGRKSNEERKDKQGDVVQFIAFKYDLGGHLRFQTEAILSSIESSRENITAWEYDALGRQTKHIEALYSPLQKVTTYSYKPSGELDVITKNDGRMLQHEYDQLGRLKELYASDDSFHYVYEYDANGNPKEVKDLQRQVSTIKIFDRDDASFLKQETMSNGLTVEYRYDTMARLKEITLPDATRIAYEYAGPYLQKVMKRTADGQTSYEHVYEDYDLNGHLRKARRIGSCGVVEYDYDLQGRLKKIQDRHFAEVIEQRDPVGNLKRRTFSDALGTVNCQYTYDSLYQLDEEEGAVNHYFVHDSHYNQELKDGELAIINDLNQLSDFKEDHFEYDLNGNRELKLGPEGEVKYAYDALDRLVAVESGNMRVSYRYDETNRRLFKESQAKVGEEWQAGKVERMIYLGPNETGVCDAQGKVLQLRLLGHGKKGAIGAAVAVELGEAVYAPLHDHLGHVVGLVSAVDGKVHETYRYSVFGEELIYDAEGEEAESTLNPWRYGGKRRDDETGLIFFGMRYYDPVFARWLTPDPIGVKGGPNLYAYVLNNPLVYVDPFGLFGSRVDMDRVYDGPSISLRQTAERIGNGLGQALRAPGEIVEQIGRHCIPIPGVRDAVAATGVLMQGRSLEGFQPSWKSNHSACLVTAEGKHVDGQYIGVTCGINTTKEAFIQMMYDVSDAYKGMRVYGLYCGTKGWTSDIIEWGIQRMGIRTNQVMKAENYCRYMGGILGDSGKLTQWNHSRGSETFYRGSSALGQGSRQQLNVFNLGGAHITEKGHYGSVVNYIGTHDYVPMLGDPIWYSRASYNPEEHNHIKFLETNTLPFMDHFWSSDQYQDVIKSRGDDFINKFGVT